MKTTAGFDLIASGIKKSFDGTGAVLGGVDLRVEGGSTLALLGPSGCGKTTLLRILAGLERPDSGTVAVAGRTLSSASTWVEPEKRNVGMVFQDWALFPHLTVEQNVGFGLSRAERKTSRVVDALDLVGLVDLRDRMPDTLSGGQQQRVALARAIAPRPSVLLLDEPFSNLDASLRTQVRTEVHRLLVDLGTTTIFVTHDQDEAFVLGDTVAVMSRGEVVQVDTPSGLYERPASRWVAEFVGEANIIEGAADRGSVRTILGDFEMPSGLVGAVDVLFRPEQLSLSPRGRGAAEGAAGKVLLVEYLGHATGYLVDVGGVELRALAPTGPTFARDDSVTVACTSETVIGFPRSVTASPDN